ncbi:hypothetical protein [Liquorilactobacillus uvarum]|uniref:hypothetical protein n=1 Tax=Liquorilactobacillus uvarum TaxID=303240 RepID=UPI00288B61E4|nr:hypothetical protein [Liquorilactobacillus uvarum]
MDNYFDSTSKDDQDWYDILMKCRAPFPWLELILFCKKKRFFCGVSRIFRKPRGCCHYDTALIPKNGYRLMTHAPLEFKNLILK